MATVTYDRRSFMIDGKRIWLVSGAVHYFRMPAALWQDRLIKAMRGGLNCVETYIPWNFHEPAEGKWLFGGDHNVVEFIQQADDMGLYVIVRPGPYICSEWDFGGLPGWLTTKPNIQYRNNSAVYTHYYDKYFRQILPRLVPLQVSQGGNVIAVQNENEYYMTTQPDRQEYLDFITQLFRRSGIDVPILTCNWLTQPLVADAIECINTWDKGPVLARRLRTMQPDAPLLATEFWSGWYDVWHRAHQRRDPRHVARRALELLGAGSQINYYMFHGGTNFGFWGGRTTSSDHHFMTTSYDYDAPIAEGGGLSRAYYLLRLVNVMAQQMGDVLAQAEPVPAAAPLSHTAAFTRRGLAGRVTVVTNNGDDSIETAPVVLDDGRELQADLRHFGAVAVFSDVPLSERHVLDYSTLMVLGVWGDVLVLHGMPGQHGCVSVNGQEIALEVPGEPAPVHVEHQGLHVIVLNSVAAERCWEQEGRLVVGPAFVGETADDVVLDASARRYYTIDPQGQIATVKPSGRAARATRLPTLGAFKRVATCAEVADAEGFTTLDRPRPLSHLGVDRGYGWYRATIEVGRAASKPIFLPDCEDRATIFVNGKPAGVWGRGAGAQRTPLTVSLARGTNELTFLVDNLGRYNCGYNLGEPKGLWGDVYAAVGVRLGSWKARPAKPKEYSRRLIPRAQQHLAAELMAQVPLLAEANLELARPRKVHVQFHDLPHTMAMFFNERMVGFFPKMFSFGDVLMSGEVRKGVNRLRLLVWGDVTARDLSSAFRLFRLEENLTDEALWQFKPWTVPTAEASGGSPRGVPAWYRATFAGPGGDAPLFLNLGGVYKGQIYLNGHNVGRCWAVGPQKHYYLPAGWLADRNELLIFSETGAAPTGSRLEYRPLGPYRTERMRETP